MTIPEHELLAQQIPNPHTPTQRSSTARVTHLPTGRHVEINLWPMHTRNAEYARTLLEAELPEILRRAGEREMQRELLIHSPELLEEQLITPHTNQLDPWSLTPDLLRLSLLEQVLGYQWRAFPHGHHLSGSAFLMAPEEIGDDSLPEHEVRGARRFVVPRSRHPDPINHLGDLIRCEQTVFARKGAEEAYGRLLLIRHIQARFAGDGAGYHITHQQLVALMQLPAEERCRMLLAVALQDHN